MLVFEGDSKGRVTYACVRNSAPTVLSVVPRKAMS
jgi:hypothetical protein